MSNKSTHRDKNPKKKHRIIVKLEGEVFNFHPLFMKLNSAYAAKAQYNNSVKYD